MKIGMPSRCTDRPCRISAERGDSGSTPSGGAVTIEHVCDIFDRWESDPAYPTLFRVDRPVLVNMQLALPGVGRRLDGVPMWCRSAGLRVEPYMPARQIGWVRRFDGGWFAACQVEAGSSNGRSRVTMQLWADPELITVDVTGLEHFVRPRPAAGGDAAGLPRRRR